MRQVLRGIRVLQVDPVNVVARNQLLVLWSRLGGFDRADLDTLLWRERWLFEYWAHAASIVLTEDYPVADYPATKPLPTSEAVARAAEHSLRALGVARARDVERHFTIGRYPGLDLERASWARPVRAGERLIGRIAARADRKQGVFVVEATFAEESFTGSPGQSVAAAITSLASFAGTASVTYASPVAFGVS